jgi:hypothetical protein
MAHAQVVNIDELRGQLIPLEDARERMAATEPLTAVSLEPGAGAEVRLGDSWHTGKLTDPADAFLRVSSDGAEYQLTRQAAAQLGSECHIPRKGQEWMSAAVLQGVINYGLAGGLDKPYKLLAQDTTVLGVTRQTITPFSNLALADAVVEGICAKYGQDTEVLVDYKFHHDLEATAVRFIVPGYHRVITNDRVPDDTWSTGVQLNNSLIGLKQTRLGGYLFRHWCTNGCYDIANATQGFSRRQDHTPEEAYAWAREQVDSILGGLEGSLDDVQALTGIPVEGEVVPVLRDLFEQHNIPKRERDRVIDTMADMGGDLSMYDVQSAVTQAANYHGLHPRSVEYLLAAGGHIAHASTGRCDGSLPGGCHRLLPPGWPVQPAAEQPEHAA